KSYAGQECWVDTRDSGVFISMQEPKMPGSSRMKVDLVGRDFVKLSGEWIIPFSHINGFSGRKPYFPARDSASLNNRGIAVSREHFAFGQRSLSFRDPAPGRDRFENVGQCSKETRGNPPCGMPRRRARSGLLLLRALGGALLLQCLLGLLLDVLPG